MTHPDRRSAPILGLTLGLVVAACGSSVDASPSGSSPPAASGSAEASSAPSAGTSPEENGETTSVFDLEVGDCFSADDDELEAVAVVPCDEEHEYEVFSVFDHEAGGDAAYPGDEELVSYADTACRPAFEEFVGTDADSSIWFITSLTPSAETWATGDREIVCTVNQEDDDGEPIAVTTSAEDSGE